MHKNYAPKSMETPKSNPSTLFYGYALPPLTSQCKYAGTVGSISTVKVNIPRVYIRRQDRLPDKRWIVELIDAVGRALWDCCLYIMLAKHIYVGVILIERLSDIQIC